jgi:hypothetical protein
LVKPVADWDVEVGNFAVVEYVALRRVVEGVLIVEDTLFEVTDSILVPLCCNSGGGFSVRNGLEESIGDAPKEWGVDVGLCLEGCLYGAG